MFRNQGVAQEERGRPGERGGRPGAGSGPDREPTSVLIRRLVSNIGALLRAYAQLTRDEGIATGRQFAVGVALIAAAVLVAISIPGLALMAAVVLLSLVLPLWAAVLITLGAAILLTGLLVGLGLRRVRARRLTAIGQKIREDLRWLQTELRGKG
jgi:Putative Actinobacterial Holin-X, holin superfamily III